VRNLLKNSSVAHVLLTRVKPDESAIERLWRFWALQLLRRGVRNVIFYASQVVYLVQLRLNSLLLKSKDLKQFEVLCRSVHIVWLFF